MLAPPEQPTDASLPEQRSFIPLTLSGQGRKRTPPGFLGLDRVLDAVGTREHPDTWGRLPGWELMPFRYDRRIQAYRGQRALRLLNGKPNVRTVALKTTRTHSELRACSELYRAVCERLLTAFETSALPAHALQRPSGETAPITAPGLWSTQGTWAFYTGLIVLSDRAGRPVTARVLVQDDDLAHWLGRHDAQDMRDRQRETRQRIGQAIRAYIDETDLRLTRAQLREMVEDVLGKGALKAKAAFADVWKALPQATGGAPEKGAKDAYKLHREALRARIQTAAEVGDTTGSIR